MNYFNPHPVENMDYDNNSERLSFELEEDMKSTE